MSPFMFSFLLVVFLQFSSLTVEPPDVVVATPTSPTEATADNFQLLIRIPHSLISKGVDRDFQNSSTVQREVMGTNSKGTAHCQGTVTCTIETKTDGAAFCCRISGTVQSDTCGTNGPAIIHSNAYTSYVAHKRFSFDGHQFTNSPASVVANTRLTITGIDSTLPRLRGRIVRRVATQRAEQSHSQAESITMSLTEQELCERIDADFDARIVELNQSFAKRLSILKHFPSAGNKIHIRSHPDRVEICLGKALIRPSGGIGVRAPMGNAIELWLRIDPGLIAQTPIAAFLVSKAPNWLATYLSSNPNLFVAVNKEIAIEAHDGWVVLRLNEG